MGTTVTDELDARGLARTGSHLARQGASLAATAAAGPTALGLRVARVSLARWRAQRAVLAADSEGRRAAIADAVGPTRHRRRWPWVLGSLVAAGGVAAVVAVLRPTPPPPPAAHPPRVDDPAPAGDPAARPGADG